MTSFLSLTCLALLPGLVAGTLASRKVRRSPFRMPSLTSLMFCSRQMGEQSRGNRNVGYMCEEEAWSPD